MHPPMDFIVKLERYQYASGVNGSIYERILHGITSRFTGGFPESAGSIEEEYRLPSHQHKINRGAGRVTLRVVHVRQPPYGLRQSPSPPDRNRARYAPPAKIFRLLVWKAYRCVRRDNSSLRVSSTLCFVAIPCCVDENQTPSPPHQPEPHAPEPATISRPPTAFGIRFAHFEVHHFYAAHFAVGIDFNSRLNVKLKLDTFPRARFHFASGPGMFSSSRR